MGIEQKNFGTKLEDSDKQFLNAMNAMDAADIRLEEINKERIKDYKENSEVFDNTAILKKYFPQEKVDFTEKVALLESIRGNIHDVAKKIYDKGIDNVLDYKLAAFQGSYVQGDESMFFYDEIEEGDFYNGMWVTSYSEKDGISFFVDLPKEVQKELDKINNQNQNL